jgi:hypothetical protein
VKINYRAAALASAAAITAAMGLALAGAASASAARPLARATAASAQVSSDSARSARVTPDVSVRYFICDQSNLCWTNEGSGHNLQLTGATAYAKWNCTSGVLINGADRTTCAYESTDGDCVTASPGRDTYEAPCSASSEAQQFWYTPSHALYALGVSEAENQGWCELDTHGDVQNARCPGPANQTSGETFTLTSN